MGKVVERTKKKKKKGRPSLLDLQKRTIKQLQHQQNNSYNNSPSHSNPNSTTATAVRRSTRRNPLPNSLSPEDDSEDQGYPQDDEEFDGKRREKKLKLVLRLPSQKSSLNSSSLNSDGSDSNAEVYDDESAKKKRKINAIGDGSGLGNLEKSEKSISGPNPTKRLQGTELNLGPSTQLPDEKLLLFVLDRLQKKDTYCVFSEPVDPEELPDYHEVIEHPMDFATVRKKLASRAYAKLEEFEKDVFLICSNAMKYNAPDTIYFKQARSIQELAKKSFRNLRQDRDDNEPEPKVVRRGRPPTKNLKQSQGQAIFERASSEFSDATLATGGENTKYHDLRKGPHLLEKFPGSRINDANTNWLAENRFERNDDFPGSLLKSYPTKNGKKLSILDENKRNTYTQFRLSAGGRELSVMNTFARERKQLMPVGINTDNGYAGSLARFAANLGPLAWQVASKKIERCLPAGVKFGRGWVVENDVIPSRPLLSPSAEGQVSLLQPFLGQDSLFPAAASSTPDIKEVKSLKIPNENNASEKHMPPMSSCSDGNPPKTPFESVYTSSSPFVTKQSPTPLTGKGHNILNSSANPVQPKPSFQVHKSPLQTGLTGKGHNILNSSANPVQPKPSFQVHKSPLQTGMNGYSNGAYGFHLSDQLGELIGSAGVVNLESAQMVDTISRTTNSDVHPSATPKTVIPASTSRVNPGSSLSKHDEALTPQTKVESVPPDLNVGFQSPGSPSSTRVDLGTHPDLALQL